MGCNYPSREQAELACYEWKEKGSNAVYTYPDLGTKRPISSRWCREEKATNQFIGWASNKVARLIKDRKIKEAGEVNWMNFEIVKHFRYQ